MWPKAAAAAETGEAGTGAVKEAGWAAEEAGVGWAVAGLVAVGWEAAGWAAAGWAAAAGSAAGWEAAEQTRRRGKRAETRWQPRRLALLP